MTDLIPTPRPVESPEDRMRHATQPEIRVEVDPTRNTIAPLATGGCVIPRTDFGTYLDRTERDQLDARAATAEQERDEALDARDVLRQQLDAMKAAKKRVLGRLERAEHALDLIRDGQEQIDRGLAAYDTQPGEPADADERTEPHEDPARLRQQLAEAHADCARYATERDEARAERDKLVETIGRLVSLPPEQIAEMHKVGYSGLGSPEARAQDEPSVVDAAKAWRDARRALANGGTVLDAAHALDVLAAAVDALPDGRAQDEPTELPAWVLDLVRGLDRYEVEHPKLFRYIRPGVYEPWDCPAPLLALVPAEVRRLVELPAHVPGERP